MSERSIARRKGTLFPNVPLVGAGVAPLALLVVWLSMIPEIEEHSGYRGRVTLLGLSLVLGTVGSVAAGVVSFLSGRRNRIASALIVLNVSVALVVTVYTFWPRTPEVMRAVHAGDIARIRTYARLGVDLDAPSPNWWDRHAEGNTPLTAAVRHGDRAMVDALLDAGASVEAAGRGRDTPLTAAVRQGDRAMVEALLDAGASVEVSGHRRDAPLHAAVVSGKPEIIDLLLRRGADIHQRPPILPLALTFRRFDLVPQLLSGGADPNDGDAIFVAIKLRPPHPDAWQLDESDVISAVQQLVAAGATLNARDRNGQTPLTAALHAERSNYVPLLIDLGADVNLKDGRGQTPLVVAARCGDLRSVRLLLDAVGYVGQSAERLRSPLVAALGAGQLAVAKELLDAGADINEGGSSDRSPILAAIGGSVREDRPEILQFALDRGARPARVNFESSCQSPLASAVQSGRVDLVTMLLDAGANPDEQHLRFRTPLVAAVERDDMAMVQLLIERGADVNFSIRDRSSPLRVAEQRNRAEIAALLRERGAE